MIIAKREFTGKPSVVGHRGFQYPNYDADDVIVPEGTHIQQLNWISGDGLQWVAWACFHDDQMQIVWSKRQKS